MSYLSGTKRVSEENLTPSPLSTSRQSRTWEQSYVDSFNVYRVTIQVVQNLPLTLIWKLPFSTGWGISSRTWVGLTWIWRVPMLVGCYCSYLHSFWCIRDVWIWRLEASLIIFRILIVLSLSFSKFSPIFPQNLMHPLFSPELEAYPLFFQNCD